MIRDDIKIRPRRNTTPLGGSANGKPKRGKSPRFELFNRVVDFAIRDLRESELKVWVAMWRYADQQNRVTVSIGHLAGVTGMTYRGVQKGMGGLMDKRLVRRIQKGRQDHTAASYLLTFDDDQKS